MVYVLLKIKDKGKNKKAFRQFAQTLKLDLQKL